MIRKIPDNASPYLSRETVKLHAIYLTIDLICRGRCKLHAYNARHCTLRSLTVKGDPVKLHVLHLANGPVSLETKKAIRKPNKHQPIALTIEHMGMERNRNEQTNKRTSAYLEKRPVGMGKRHVDAGTEVVGVHVWFSNYASSRRHPLPAQIRMKLPHSVASIMLH